MGGQGQVSVAAWRRAHHHHPPSPFPAQPTHPIPPLISAPHVLGSNFLYASSLGHG